MHAKNEALWAWLIVWVVEQTEKRFFYLSLLSKDFLPSLGSKSEF